MRQSFAVRFAIRFALAGGLFLVTSAESCDEGERAQWGCPPDEECDPATENGLHFVGPTIAEDLFDDHGIKQLATGGRQTVTVFDLDDAGHHLSLDLPFVASVGQHVAVERVEGNVLSLRSDASPSRDYLRITSAETGLLFDRVQLVTHEIESIRLTPSLAVAIAAAEAEPQPLYTPGARATISLRSANDTVLVDEDSAITGAGIAQVGWDRFEIGNLEPGTYSATVAAGNHVETVSFEVTHATSLDSVFDTPLTRSSSALVCFGAKAGERPIHAGWRFEVEGGSIDATRFQGCVEVRAGSGDSVTVHAFADGLTTQLALPVVDEPQAKPRRAARPITTAGERASRR